MRISSTRKYEYAQRNGARREVSNSPSTDRVLLSVAAAGTSVGAGALALSAPTHTDKLQHIGLTGAATLALGAVGVSPEAAAGTVFVGASLGKEFVYDLLWGRGNASWLDVSANLAGTLAGYALLKSMQSGQGTSLTGRPGPSFPSPETSGALRLA